MGRGRQVTVSDSAHPMPMWRSALFLAALFCRPVSGRIPAISIKGREAGDRGSGTQSKAQLCAVETMDTGCRITPMLAARWLLERFRISITLRATEEWDWLLKRRSSGSAKAPVQ